MDNYTKIYEFPTFLGGGGIPLHIYGNEFMHDTNIDYSKQIGGNMVSSLYFPGGLFINPFVYDLNLGEKEKDIISDPTTKNVFEEYDVFLDLVSGSNKKSSPSHTTKNKTKKSKKST
jgi:hypothetical protein